jgi:putative flippase GtrA
MTENQFSFKKLFFQFCRFFVVGIANTAIHTGLYWIFWFIARHMETAKVLAWLLSVFIGHVIHKKFVFKGKLQLKQVMRAYMAYTLALVLELVIMRAGVTYFVGRFGIEHIDLIEKLIIFLPMPLTIPLNFVMNKVWANKEKWSDS